MPTRRLTRLEQRELLQKAIAASGMSARRFAAEVLLINERTLRRYITGDYVLLDTSALRICQMLVDRQ